MNIILDDAPKTNIPIEIKITPPSYYVHSYTNHYLY